MTTSRIHEHILRLADEDFITFERSVAICSVEAFAPYWVHWQLPAEATTRLSLLMPAAKAFWWRRQWRLNAFRNSRDDRAASSEASRQSLLEFWDSIGPSLCQSLGHWWLAFCAADRGNDLWSEWARTILRDAATVASLSVTQRLADSRAADLDIATIKDAILARAFENSREGALARSTAESATTFFRYGDLLRAMARLKAGQQSTESWPAWTSVVGELQEGPRSVEQPGQE